MNYKIGDVARILGISPDLLRYYEKKGVVTPTKDKNNDYRYYDAWDINFLMDCLWFKNFGFSIEQIADMVRIPSAEALDDLFEYKEDELRSTIRRCTLLLKRSAQHRAELREAQEMLGRCRVEQSPELVSFINRVEDEYPAEARLQRMAARWLDLLPYNHRYFEIQRDSLVSGERSGYAWGQSLTMDFVRELEVEVEPPMTLVESCRCLYTVFKSSGKGNFGPHLLDYAVKYADDHGLRICGDARGMLVASILEEGELSGYFRTWIPIED